LYGVVAQISIGQLFTAAMIPGILMMLVFAGTTLVYLKIYGKEFETNAIKNDVNEETPVMRYITVVLAGSFIVAAIFGGIYLGIFTPTEAGAVGAFIAFILALILKKVTRNF